MITNEVEKLHLILDWIFGKTNFAKRSKKTLTHTLWQVCIEKGGFIHAYSSLFSPLLPFLLPNLLLVRPATSIQPLDGSIKTIPFHICHYPDHFSHSFQWNLKISSWSPHNESLFIIHSLIFQDDPGNGTPTCSYRPCAQSVASRILI